MPANENNTRIIKSIAQQLGFDYCGIAKATTLNNDAKRLEQWLRQGKHASMQYMENYFDLRINPTKLFPGARSVITVLQNYYPYTQQAAGTPHISKYAYGNDYHNTIRKKLKTFLQLLKEKIGNIQGRGFVDSAPVLERSWAVRSGLGWIGKNGNLINKTSGSFYFIATLICDIDCVYDDTFAKDYCGTCNRCVSACPTNALLPNKVVDGSKCIAYFTIELKEQTMPNEMVGKFKDWIFGCDICQDVCPWNRFSKPNTEPTFAPLPEVLNLSTADWEHLTQDSFKKIFGKSALKRAGYKGIQRNIRFITNAFHNPTQKYNAH